MPPPLHHTSMSTTFGVLKIFLNLVLIHVAVQYCYKMNLLSYKKTDTKNYRLTMEIHNNNTVSSQTNVYKEIPIPAWHLTLMQRSHSQEKTHYNGTIRRENGNLSLDCPMPVGRYILHNLFVPQDSNFLKFIYSPNALYTLNGRVLSLLPNKREDILCTYEINGTISKMC